MTYLAAEHFVRAPEWTWYILGYFFFAGLSGGSYALATMLRLAGDSRDEHAARLGYYAAFITMLICPMLLTADLGASWLRFWHMLVDVTPGDTGLNFKYWSPMSVGVWVLLVYGLFATVSAFEAFVLDRRASSAPGVSGSPRFGTVQSPTAGLGGAVGRAFNIIGGVLALLFASYTGVLLSVSNQPVWSDTWVLGGLFLASGLSGAAALITLLVRYRPGASFTLDRLRVADGYFSILELALLLAFIATVALAGTAGRLLVWLPLWVLAVIGIGASLAGMMRPAHVRAATGEAAAVAPVAIDAVIMSVLVLLAVLAMRAAVIFSAQ